MKIITGEEGKCPKCNSEDLEYEDSDISGEGASYYYICNDCGFKGIEWYNITFSNHLTIDGNDIHKQIKEVWNDRSTTNKQMAD